MKLFWVMIIALLFVSAPSFASPLSDADAAFERGDYPTALKLLQPLAEEGFAEAQYNIGYLYYHGKGIKQDYAEAEKWLRKAAARNELDAQHLLGELYSNGKNGNDYAESYFWYRLAGRVFKSDAESAGKIGSKITPEQIETIEKKLADWKPEPIPPEIAAKQLAEAQAVNTHRFYGPHDKRTALILLWPLANQANAEAQKHVAFMYWWGYDDVKNDRAESVKWYVKAAELGDANAMWAAADRYESGNGVPQNYEEAAKWFRRAAEQGYAHAQERLGEMYMDGRGVKRDSAEGLKWLHMAAEQWDVSAIIELGKIYEKGERVKQDYAQAYFWKIISPTEHFRIDQVSAHLTPEEKASVEKKARQWQKDHAAFAGDPIQD